MKKMILSASCAITLMSTPSFAQDISGVWQQIDDQTGSARALIQISKNREGNYDGTIIKLTPRDGYTPKQTCNNCPSPYTNQPILGLNVLTNLKQQDRQNYENGQILDPLSGKVYAAKVRVNSAGNRLTLKGYIGVSALGRSQTWLKAD